jgi:hypothetical protein
MRGIVLHDNFQCNDQGVGRFVRELTTVSFLVIGFFSFELRRG